MRWLTSRRIKLTLVGVLGTAAVVTGLVTGFHERTAAVLLITGSLLLLAVVFGETIEHLSLKHGENEVVFQMAKRKLDKAQEKTAHGVDAAEELADASELLSAIETAHHRRAEGAFATVPPDPSATRTRWVFDSAWFFATTFGAKARGGSYSVSLVLPGQVDAHGRGTTVDAPRNPGAVVRVPFQALSGALTPPAGEYRLLWRWDPIGYNHGDVLVETRVTFPPTPADLNPAATFNAVQARRGPSDGPSTG